ncbi:hypothetical protein GCM10009785_26560 [Brooklawnia cerclae]|uniref:Nucleic acid-binding Zn ribbon protein n=1 Tax=Brooklawnia cerclae TaxID=349934 RepID=A0ABX0SJ56_9ACTN|nr:MucR family transcriptional regulator [Brooklawnia cerclae]NIH57338.1 putative nucleic acid-binding Zn ribbon protein [Brooklawnia cerclae]
MTAGLCTVSGCGQKAVARGWCMQHYKQWRRTGEIPVAGRQVGEPDGHGRYGVLERHDDAALCHECGGWYVSVGAHVRLAHDMTADDYRRAHGLKRTQPLTALSYAARQSERASGMVGSSAWRRLEAARDPQAAADARTPDVFRAPAGSAIHAEGATDGRLDLHRPAAEKTCPVCGRTYTGRDKSCSDECARELWRRGRRRQAEAVPQLDDDQVGTLRRATGEALDAEVRRLQAAGYTSASIGEALGHGPAWMSRRYPRGGK